MYFVLWDDPEVAEEIHYQQLSDFSVHFAVYCLVLHLCLLAGECTAGWLELPVFSVAVLLAGSLLTVVIFMNFLIFRHMCYSKKYNNLA